MPSVITGLGVVSPIGVGEAAFNRALIRGDSAIIRGTDFATAKAGENQTQLYAPIGPFGAETIPAPQRRKMPRLIQTVMIAAKEALAQANLTYSRERIGVVFATGLGTLEETLRFTKDYVLHGPEAASPTLFQVSVMNAAAGQLAISYDLKGVNTTINHRQHSPLSALLLGSDLLELRRADAIVVAAADELSAPGMHAYASLGGLAKEVMRPYDQKRDGQILGEMAVAVVIERAEDAQKRGAKIRAAIGARGETGESRSRVGWGHKKRFTEAARAVELACHKVRERIDWICGGGNGSTLDERELEALNEGLGGLKAPVSSFLAQTGESMSSPLLRVVASVHAIETGAIPGTMGLLSSPPEFAEQLVRTARTLPSIKRVLLPSFAEGGANLALLIEHPSLSC